MKSKDKYTGIRGIIKFIAKVLSWTSLVILVLIAFLLAYYTIGSKIAERTGGDFEPLISLYTIVSPSMTPNINVYDVVVNVKVNKPSDIKVGDVITFTSTSSISRGFTVTHRVVEVIEDENGVSYKTKGDNNLSADSSPATYDNVIGKVILRIPQLGRVQYFLASQGGWIIAVVIPALFIIITDILKIFKLVGVKTKIEQMDEAEKLSKKKQKDKEELRKEVLRKQLKIDKNDNEPDPIIIKKETRIVVAEKSKIEEKISKARTRKKKDNSKSKK
jgi:signal peptidase